MDLSPSKPHFAQNVAVKKAEAAESSDDEAKPATKEELTKATLKANFFDEKYALEEIYRKAKEASEKKKEVRNEEYDHLNIIKCMPTYLIHSIDFTKFNEVAVYQYALNVLVGNREVSGIQNPSFLKQLKASISKYKTDNKSFEISISLCNAMTIEQLESLKSFTQGGTDPNVIGCLFSKRRCEQLSKEVIDSMTNAQKYENMISLYRDAKSDGMPKSLQYLFLENALALGPKACVYDLDLFNELVKWKEYKYGGGSTAQKIGNFFANALLDSHENKYWGDCIRNLPSDAFNPSLFLTHFAF